MKTFTAESFARWLARRPPAYQAEAKACAQFVGGAVLLPDECFDALQAKYYPKPSTPRGLGDAVAAIATPIARVLGLGCIDPATNQLRPESACAQRRAALNRLVPDL